MEGNSERPREFRSSGIPQILVTAENTDSFGFGDELGNPYSMELLDEGGYRRPSPEAEQ